MGLTNWQKDKGNSPLPDKVVSVILIKHIYKDTVLCQDTNELLIHQSLLAGQKQNGITNFINQIYMYMYKTFQYNH